ncbi:MAG: dTDP-glucose 4,6-dehydratase [Verrucomicrobia bacterium RIFCSPHIGHO2_12_FULL_41_10]|nr:MAG: dTDP-glucose 4,6-dehydratase [Verrucomicrobia bacterium RIFCSPHIGHO2_12_FULL_41_10]HLB34460.1 dTDP-glucose 4,6-dehydratase [Chthoniobacterales bacterium]
MRIIVTGGCGFIGSNFVRQVLARSEVTALINIDDLTYAGNLENLTSIDKDPRYRLVKADIADAPRMESLFKEETQRGGEPFDAIINFAAESHVDRSITGPAEFIRTNIVGTGVLLQVAREHGIKRFLQVSTDEVYGSLGPQGRFTETTPLSPNSPYSASKAGADLLVAAAYHTYGQDTLITRCSNNYGPYQFAEKLIPLMIISALHDRPLPVYGDGLNIRDWIHVEDHCEALWQVLIHGRSGEVYNVGADSERSNIDVVHQILKYLKKPESLINYVTDRLGHDRRYAIDSSKIHEELGWKPQRQFSEGLIATIRWYLEHESWWKNQVAGSICKVPEN